MKLLQTSAQLTLHEISTAQKLTSFEIWSHILLSEISLIKRHKMACVTSKNDKSQTAVLPSEMAVSKI